MGIRNKTNIDYNKDMIFVFHGDDIIQSRQSFLDNLKKQVNTEVLRLESKNINLDSINGFLQSKSLFNDAKILAFENFFSIHKSTQEKILKLLSNSTCNIYIWQDKNLTVAQLKSLPNTDIKQFKLDNQLYACLNAVKPGNLKAFLPLYRQVIDLELYDLFLYLLKGNLRRQLLTFSRFNQNNLIKCYLQLIELDYQNKTGQLSLSKDISLERIILNLIK